MSGHSKWSTIKRKKGAADVKRGAEFSKLARLIEVAAKSGADPNANFRLKLAVQTAKSANLPAANIERAIRKGAGLDKDASNIDEIAYEGVGPGNIAVLIQAMTDNKNRTVSELRSLFTKAGGNLGNSGSVAWQFQNKGVILVPKSGNDMELKLIDAGAEDFGDVGDAYEVYTDPKALNQVKQNLLGMGLSVKDDRLAMIPNSLVKITNSAQAQKIVQFIEALEDHQDVAEVFTNFDIDDSTLAAL
ncbi:MAG: YebC/PmpR family DNA-binding transcriptional regulator [bacterium]